MHNRLRWGAGLAASAALAAAGGAARAQDAAGDWHGTLTSPAGMMLRVGLTLKAKAGGGYEGSLTSPDQGPDEIPLDQAKVEAGTLNFSIAAIQGSYSGRWDAGRKAWVGQWTQGSSVPLVLTAGKP
jgi:hypothetical protein